MAHPPRWTTASRPRNTAGNRPVPVGGSVAGAAPAGVPGETRDDVRRRLWDTVAIARLPRPPRSGPEWRQRAEAVDRNVPGLLGHLGHAPVGWFPLIERAGQEVARLLPRNQRLVTEQIKEKYGTLRWYAHVSMVGCDGPGDHAALGATDWAEDASARTCAAFGTSDGELHPDGWWLTLSPDARATRERDHHGLRDLLYPDWARD